MLAIAQKLAIVIFTFIATIALVRCGVRRPPKTDVHTAGPHTVYEGQELLKQKDKSTHDGGKDEKEKKDR